MPFRPRNENHAIQEVVFVLTLQRAFLPTEVEALVAAHDKWKADLPGMKKIDGFQFEFGDDLSPTQSAVPMAGVSFDAHKRDGSLDWRLRANQNWLAVNCLSYTRWADVYARARGYLSAASAVIPDENQVVGIALQYIDVFEWEGELANYKLDGLFRAGTDFVSKSVFGKGPLWHAHQGWFRTDGLIAPGRQLERIHIDAVEQKNAHQVKIDITLRLDLQEKCTAASLFAGKAPLVDQVMDSLHIRNKELLSGILKDDVIQRIKLNA